MKSFNNRFFIKIAALVPRSKDIPQALKARPDIFTFIRVADMRRKRNSATIAMTSA